MRSTTVVATGVLVLALLAAPVAAQEEEGSYRGVIRHRVGDLDPALVQPGDATTYSTAPDVFQAGTTVDLFLVRARQGDTAVVLATDVTVAGDGSVSHTFTVPEDLEPGVYFVFATGTRPDGSDGRVVAVMVVLPPPSQAGTSGGAGTSGESRVAGATGTAGNTGTAGGDAAPRPSGDAGAPPPAEVQDLQAPAGEEARLLARSAETSSPVVVSSDGSLAVVADLAPDLAAAGGGPEGTAGTPLGGLGAATAGAAALLAVAGLVARRRHRT